ncbi:hypothetical protein SY83_21545 [Paenibacillus swuensis]|uniref:Uncharacterized protein n=2 Tax=Paenibacillus swuensis TaxID=1178515 RepID=A0A172TQ55_9BACL|nr:hypothetical protein SY83_21545 [Paenibacillus swuensis]
MLAIMSVFGGMGGGAALADWAYKSVANDGYLYEVTDVKVEEARIGKKIGYVTKYSDREGSYSGNFSNAYAVGTGYYAIIGMGRKQAISVKVDEETYLMAEYRYSNKTQDWTYYVPYLIGATGVAAIALYRTHRNRRRLHR